MPMTVFHDRRHARFGERCSTAAAYLEPALAASRRTSQPSFRDEAVLSGEAVCKIVIAQLTGSRIGHVLRAAAACCCMLTNFGHHLVTCSLIGHNLVPDSSRTRVRSAPVASLRMRGGVEVTLI